MELADVSPAMVSTGDTRQVLSVKTVMRGKIKASVDCPVDMRDPLRRSTTSVCLASVYGLLFEILGNAVKVSQWKDVEKCYVEMEHVLLEGPMLPKVRDSIREPQGFAKLCCRESTSVFRGIRLSHDETWLCAWSADEVALFDLGGLEHGMQRAPACTYKCFDNDIEDVCFSNGDDKLYAVSGSEVLVLSGSKSDKVLSKIELEGKGLACSADPSREKAILLAIAGTNGSVWFASEEKCVSGFTIAGAIDGQVEAHSLYWINEETLAVGFRTPFTGTPPGEGEGGDEDEEPPLPHLGIFKIDVDSKHVTASALFEDPLDYGVFDKPWEHRFFFDKIPHLDALVVASTWNRNFCLISSPPDTFDWKIVQVLNKANEETSYTQVCDASIWSFAERPWVWALEDDDGDFKYVLQNDNAVMGMVLARCVKAEIIPFHIYGDNSELETKPNFAPPPTLMFFNSDGVLETVALVDTDYTVTNGIARPIVGMIRDILPLPNPRESPKHDEIQKHPQTQTPPLNSKTFEGKKEGYFFGKKDGNVGYHKDEPRQVTFFPPSPENISRERGGELIRDFYSRAKPEKLASVDSIADKYFGNYRVLFTKLESMFPGVKVACTPEERDGPKNDGAERQQMDEPENLQKENQAHQDKLEQERVHNLEQERLRKLEQERLNKLEQERLQKQEQEHLKREELIRLQQEQARIQKEQQAQQQRQAQEKAERERELKQAEWERLKQMQTSSEATAAKPTTGEDNVAKESMSARKKRIDEKKDKYMKGLEDNVKKLQKENEALAREVERLRRQDILQTPPKVGTLTLKMSTNSSASRKTPQVSSRLLTLYKDKFAEPEKETEQLLKGIMLLMEEKSADLIDDYGNQVNSEWVKRDKAFEENVINTANEANRQLAYVKDVLKPSSQQENDRLAAIRRNYLAQESMLQECVQRVEKFAQSEGDNVDDEGDDEDIIRMQETVQILTERMQYLEMQFDFINEQIQNRKKDLARRIKEQHKNPSRFLSQPNRAQQKKKPPKEIMERALLNYKDAQNSFRQYMELGARLSGLRTLLSDIVDVDDANTKSLALVATEDRKPKEIVSKLGTKVTSSEDVARSMNLTAILAQSFAACPKICDSNGMEKQDIHLDSKPSLSQREELRWRRGLLAKVAKESVTSAKSKAESSAMEFLASFASSKKVGLGAQAEKALENFANPPSLKHVVPTEALGVSWQESNKDDASSSSLSSGQPRKTLTRSAPITVTETKSDSNESKKSGGLFGGLSLDTKPKTEEEEKKPEKGGFSFSLGDGSTKSGGLFGGANTSSSSSATKSGPGGGLFSSSPQPPTTPASGKAEESKTSLFGSAGATTPGAPQPSAASTPQGENRDLSNVDMEATLLEFYKKHNPDNIVKIPTHLQKYQGEARQNHMLNVLEKKYNTKIALVPKSGSTATPSSSAAGGGFAGFAGSGSIGAGFGFGSATTSQTKATGFGQQAAPSTPPQQGGGFGGGGFGSSGFGGAASTTTTPPQQGSGFGSTGFGAQSAQGGGGGGGGAAGGFGASGFGGGATKKSHQEMRQLLLQFYQQKNPAKVNSVDQTLEQYKGREDLLFTRLEQKYGQGTTGYFTQQQQQPKSGGGFSGFAGSSSTGFGSTASTGGGFGGGGFGSTGFGSSPPPQQQQNNQSAGGFGGFGSSGFGSTGFGGSQGASSGFGAASKTQTPPQQQGGFGGGGFSSFGAGATGNTAGGFGAASNPSGGGFGGFGASNNNSGGGFGSSGFGGGNASGGSGFGASSSGGFGGGGFGASSSSSSGFGGGGFGASAGGNAFGGGAGGGSYSGASFTQMRK